MPSARPGSTPIFFSECRGLLEAKTFGMRLLDDGLFHGFIEGVLGIEVLLLDFSRQVFISLAAQRAELAL